VSGANYNSGLLKGTDGVLAKKSVSFPHPLLSLLQQAILEDLEELG
jgi:hypothetical protein